MNHTIDYPSMIDTAMRSVVKEALQQVVRSGLPGEHHFYISFRTDYPGARVSESLKSRYPEEMTIVVQHQFWDLQVTESGFSIMLSFNNIPEKLVIPFNAMTAFADPSIKFGLQFHGRPLPEDATSGVQDTLAKAIKNMSPKKQPKTAASDNEEPPAAGAEVITLDAFRKK